ncbi:MAG: 3,5-nucleoside bisphosphate phosphatase [Solirubrobacteraceae bacterium]|nr:3,5-nucleoside bisphosphate phosphatase [Solirubrobacteraceae bacterium]
MPGAPTFDLQSHSVHSDGHLPAAEVVQRAAAAGVELLALSDHDTVDGVDEALAAAAQCGIGVVPATELSSIDGTYDDLHVLGYGIDHTDPVLLTRLEEFRADREGRAGRMATALNELGFEIDDDLLAARRAAGKPIGRPHLAQAVIDHPANAQRLREEGTDDVSPFIVAYLIAGKPGFRGRTMPTVEQAIGVIHDAGGVAIWAHPYWDVDKPEDVAGAIERFAGFGVDGVEAFYVTHDEAQTQHVADLCAQRGLLTTGSSDFHGPDHKLFSRFRAFQLFDREPNLGPIGEPIP